MNNFSALILFILFCKAKVKDAWFSTVMYNNLLVSFAASNAVWLTVIAIVSFSMVKKKWLWLNYCHRFKLSSSTFLKSKFASGFSRSCCHLFGEKEYMWSMSIPHSIKWRYFWQRLILAVKQIGDRNAHAVNLDHFRSNHKAAIICLHLSHCILSSNGPPAFCK